MSSETRRSGVVRKELRIVTTTPTHAVKLAIDSRLEDKVRSDDSNQSLIINA